MLGKVIKAVTDREWDRFLPVRFLTHPHVSFPIKNGMKRGMMEKIKRSGW